MEPPHPEADDDDVQYDDTDDTYDDTDDVVYEDTEDYE